MKVLLVHNFYRSSSPSGEDAVFHNEKTMLEKNGSEIIEYTKHSDVLAGKGNIGLLKTSYEMAWSKKTYKELSKIIKETRPDIAHFHNTFPLISPSAYAACRDASVPVVQTLHNFRLICPGALLLRDSKPCESCLDGSLLPAFKYRCYRDSRLATAALIRMLLINRQKNTYTQLVDRYIALTNFAASRFIKSGFPSEKITVKSNFLPHSPATGTGEGEYAVYVGRLSPEKGVRTLVQAWQDINNDKKLIILGDGPSAGELKTLIDANNLNIELGGYRNKQEILSIVADAAVQIIPSEWYEGFPMVVLEALSCGTPIIASDIGSLGEIIENNTFGFKFEAGNPTSLANTINDLFDMYDNNKNAYLSFRNRAKDEFDDKYIEEINFKVLKHIYTQVIENAKNS